jgi:CheY-like chemotaxis protein
VRVTVATDLPATPLIATADPGDILHLVLNLALNARDALHAEGGRITLGLRRAKTDDLARAPLLGALDQARRYAVISVCDDGQGVPPELGASIFMPHVSTKGDAGTGLGLAIVAGVIADNDAALVLTSAPGEGALFEVFWPLDPAMLAADDVPPTAADAAGVSLAGLAILVVEDSPAMLDAIGAMLERAGAEVGPCESPVMALEAIEEDPSAWDLVITDLEMPELDGAALAARTRAAAPATPVILCTGAPEAVISAVGGRFDAILRKPVSENALVAAARSALARTEKGDQ